MDEERGQEILQKAIELRQQSEEVERQLEFTKEQIGDLEKFSKNLETLKESSEDEMLANIGRGVHMKVSRKKDEKLFVEVGSGVIVKKTPEEALKIIGEQIAKFREAKNQLTMQLQDHASQFGQLMEEVEGLRDAN